ncbi:MAG TPA: Spy/CpxP family protein refolding chaperone [Bryobacteraceae bacterium]|nr:Spy/CpxP family protein refolding chaperone [Bryobacteraceae bacterium]
MRKQGRNFGLALLFTSALVVAQPTPQPAHVPEPLDVAMAAEQETPPPGHGPRPEGPPPPRAARPPMERAFHGPPGRWWNNPEMAQKLGLTADQQKKMDDIFQQSRLRLIDLNAALQKEEAIMEPLVSADQPEEAKVLAQIDRVAQARAELEKANARMLLGIRRTLNPDQWKKLQAETPPPADHGPGSGTGRLPRR